MEKTPAEDSVYQAMYKRHGWNPDVYIWINTSPYQCFNNMKTRDQSGDVSVSLEYLENLNKNYEKIFESMNCLKYEINGSESIDTVHEQILKIIEAHYYKNGKPM